MTSLACRNVLSGTFAPGTLFPKESRLVRRTVCTKEVWSEGPLCVGDLETCKVLLSVYLVCRYVWLVGGLCCMRYFVRGEGPSDTLSTWLWS